MPSLPLSVSNLNLEHSSSSSSTYLLHIVGVDSLLDIHKLEDLHRFTHRLWRQLGGPRVLTSVNTVGLQRGRLLVPRPVRMWL